MALNNNCEGGVDGTNVTVAGSGGASGDAFTNLVVNNNGANAGSVNIQYRFAAAITGGMGIRLTPGSASLPSYVRYDVTGDETRPGARVEFKYAQHPGSEWDIIIIRNATATLATATIHTDGDILLRNGSTNVAVSRSPVEMTPGKWYAVELLIEPDASNGRISLLVENLTDGTIHHQHSEPGLATAAGPARQYRYGNLTTAILPYVDLDNFRAGVFPSGWIGRAPNTPPTVNAGADQNVTEGATVHLAATASDPDGSVASYAWTFDHPTSGAPALTGASTASPSFTAGAAGQLYVLRCTVTDNLGATGVDTVEVRVPVPGDTAQRFAPQNGTGTGTWTRGGGAATDGAALSDETDSTYLESPALSGSPVTRRLRVVPGNAKADATLRLRMQTDTGTSQVTVRLYEGATLRHTFTAVTVTTTAALFEFPVPSGVLAAMTDPLRNLFVDVSATG